VDVNQLDAATLRQLTTLPCPGVIDHMGYVCEEHSKRADPNAPGFQTLLSLVDDAGFWVKLTGAYRTSTDHDTYEDVTPLAQALVAAAPDRMLWGSDWSHVGLRAPEPMPDTGALQNALPRWIPDAATRRQILEDNPARLYGFSTNTD